MRFFRFPTAMVRPLSSLAKFSFVISNIPFPQFSSPPLYNSPAHAALAPRESQLCGAISADLETQILHCHCVEKWRVATGQHDTMALEKLHRFPVIPPNSGHRDYSRSSCDGGRRGSGLGRVEDGRGNLGHAATLRFPSSLIEPDVPISGIRLSDWLHREAHGERLWPQASSVQQLSLLRLTIQLSLKGPDHSRCLQAHRQSPSPCHLRKHTRSQGPSLRRHYPASTVV